MRVRNWAAGFLTMILAVGGCQSGTPQPADAGAARPALPEPDLSTIRWAPRPIPGQSFESPGDVLKSLDLALASGDVQAMVVCLRDPANADARRQLILFFDMLAAQTQCARRAAERFGPPTGDEVPVLSLADTYRRLHGAGVEGQVILLPIDDDPALEHTPPAIHFRRVAGSWRIDAQKTWQLNGKAPPEVRHVLIRWMAPLLIGMRDVQRTALRKLNAGDFANWPALMTYLDQQSQSLATRLASEDRIRAFIADLRTAAAEATARQRREGPDLAEE